MESLYPQRRGTEIPIMVATPVKFGVISDEELFKRLKHESIRRDKTETPNE